MERNVFTFFRDIVNPNIFNRPYVPEVLNKIDVVTMTTPTNTGHLISGYSQSALCTDTPHIPSSALYYFLHNFPSTPSNITEMPLLYIPVRKFTDLPNFQDKNNTVIISELRDDLQNYPMRQMPSAEAFEMYKNSVVAYGTQEIYKLSNRQKIGNDTLCSYQLSRMTTKNINSNTTYITETLFGLPTQTFSSTNTSSGISNCNIIKYIAGELSCALMHFRSAPQDVNIPIADTGYQNNFLVFKDEQTISDILTAYGIPHIFRLSDLNKPLEEIPGYTLYPTDETDDDITYPDNATDVITAPPSKLDVANTFCNRYWLLEDNVNQFHSWLFNSTFLDDVKLLWTDAGEYIISLHCYPFDVSQVTQANQQSITVGGLDSNVIGGKISNGLINLDGGNVDITPYYGSYLDYQTSISIYIPYCGTYDLDTGLIMGKKLNLTYSVDLITGACTAYLYANGSLITQFSGQMAVDIALNGTSQREIANKMLTVSVGAVATIGAIAVTGGAVGMQTVGATSQLANSGISALEQQPKHYGRATGLGAFSAPQYAHIIIKRPKLANSSLKIKMQGHSTSYSGKISDFSGFLSVKEVLTTNLTATKAEQDEILNLLKQGVFVNG